MPHGPGSRFVTVTTLSIIVHFLLIMLRFLQQPVVDRSSNAMLLRAQSVSRVVVPSIGAFLVDTNSESIYQNVHQAFGRTRF